MSMFSVIEEFMPKWGISCFSLTHFFLSDGAKKFRRGTPLCSRKFLVSKNVWGKRWGGHHVFPSELFRLTEPKLFVGLLFSVSLISAMDKLYA